VDVPPPGHRDRHRYAIDDRAAGIVLLDQVAENTGDTVREGPRRPGLQEVVDQDTGLGLDIEIASPPRAHW
jgi:hypothetical protein